jgi:hypothetical protein
MSSTYAKLLQLMKVKFNNATNLCHLRALVNVEVTAVLLAAVLNKALAASNDGTVARAPAQVTLQTVLNVRHTRVLVVLQQTAH